jgi:molybdenum-dependent DNA-binding transcriptional regulator ModE
MNWRFDDILTFMSVVEAGSVTSAATRLNVSKSAISKRISDLEAALRVELFHRSTGNVKPTELAQSFYERIVELIRGITEATEEISQRTARLTGRLRVTAPISFGTNFLGPVIAEFARRHPELAIAVDYEDRLVKRHRLAPPQPSGQMADQMQRLLVGNLGGRRQRSLRALRDEAGAVAQGEDTLLALGQQVGTDQANGLAGWPGSGRPRRRRPRRCAAPSAH